MDFCRWSDHGQRRLGICWRTRREQALGGEKSVIVSACEKFIAEVLKQRFLREIRSTEFNYPIALCGKWHGNKYRFITRSGPTTRGRTSRNSKHPLHVWSMSAGIVSICITTGTRVNGSACLSACRSPKPST